MKGRSGVGSIDTARDSSSHHAEKAHGDQRGPLDGRFGTTWDANPSSMRLGRGAACQKCLKILFLIVTILPMDRATIHKHEDTYILQRSGTHERYSALWCTHDERLHEEQPTH